MVSLPASLALKPLTLPALYKAGADPEYERDPLAAYLSVAGRLTILLCVECRWNWVSGIHIGIRFRGGGGEGEGWAFESSPRDLPIDPAGALSPDPIIPRRQFLAPPLIQSTTFWKWDVAIRSSVSLGCSYTHQQNMFSFTVSGATIPRSSSIAAVTSHWIWYPVINPIRGLLLLASMFLQCAFRR